MKTKKITQRFQRSTRIDQDLQQQTPLDGFVLHKTGATIIDRLFEQLYTGKQRAFTWTGSFGTGKSTLALFLAALLGPNKALRAEAREHFSEKKLKKLEGQFSSIKTPWLVVPVVGKKEDPLKVISVELDKANDSYWGKSLPENLKSDYDHADSGQVIDHLKASAQALHEQGGGLLLIVDEMGKFLEYVHEESGDIYIFQDLAESLGRLEFPTIFLGLLHQAFQEYTSRLDRQKREEWSKVQGRFLDTPFSINLEESVALICEALGKQRATSQLRSLSTAVVAEIKSGRLVNFQNLPTFLAKCKPLHPLTTLILSVLSRQRFGQNQRSIFAFLSSVEPCGLQDFISHNGTGLTGVYTVDLLWDYLEINLEPVILASPVGHKWADATETLDRASRLGMMEVRILKAVNIVDLFGRPFGILATDQMMVAALPQLSRQQIEVGLKKLRTDSCLVYRRHLNAWSTFSGSDIDIDHEIDLAARGLSNDIAVIANRLPQLRPIVAKRHYHQTGTMRWFEFEIIPEEQIKDNLGFVQKLRADGAFMLVLGKTKSSEAGVAKLSKELAEYPRPVAVGFVASKSRLIELATEFAALNKVLETVPEVQTDAVARKELHGRADFFRRALDDQFEVALESVAWFYDGKSLNCGGKVALSILASDLSDVVYGATPTLKNELLNRHQPSSNAVAACRALMKIMVESPHKERLGIEKSPTELGLYLSLLRSNGLHKKTSKKGGWAFVAPPKSSSLVGLWNEMGGWLQKSQEGGPVSLNGLYGSLEQAPFGLRSGVMPLMVLSFILARSDEVAVYIDGLFTPSIDDFFVDRMLQDPSSISVRLISMTGVRKEVLKRITGFINEELGTSKAKTALDAAKQLVQFAFRLPPWVKNTKELSEETKRVRDTLLKARDPNALLFEDLPEACGFKKALDESTIEEFLKVVERVYGELSSAYDVMLDGFRAHVVKAFGYSARSKKSLESIRQRAEALRSRTGEMVLEGFVVRILSAQTSVAWTEGLLSFVTKKSPQDWNDSHIVKGKLEVTNLVDRFEKTERFLRSHQPNSASKLRALSIFVSDRGKEIVQYDTSIDLSNGSAQEIDTEAIKLLQRVKETNLGAKREVAVLIKAAEMILKKKCMSEVKL